MRRRTFLATATASSLVARSATAAAGPAPLLRFGLITDAQNADADPKGERHYRETPGKLKSAVETIRAAKPAFTLHLGDFIDRDFTAFATLLPLLDGLGHPVHHLLGNHDYVTFRSMLHEPGITAFSVVDVHADRIVITGHGREESRTLKY